MVPMDVLTPELLTYALIAVNFVTFAAFGIDKMLAEVGPSGSVRRISEAALLMWAIFGGTPGAYAARAAFRHKTRKQPFSTQLHGIAVIQVLLVAAFVFWRMTE
jgi:uncharacterized membrane protein YsdA (DUF1294 family)